jgi:hypothetical protein
MAITGIIRWSYADPRSHPTIPSRKSDVGYTVRLDRQELLPRVKTRYPKGTRLIHCPAGGSGPEWSSI